MTETPRRFGPWTLLGALMLVVGIAVFAIRLQHAGPYAPPEEGNLRAALLALLLGAWLASPAAARPALASASQASRITWIAIAASPIVLFFALYATLAEVEEVISVDVVDPDGNAASLRLWVVDRDDGAWVIMPGSKAERYGLADTWVDMIRDGERSCVEPELHDAPETVKDIVARRYEKYAVHRLATAVGLFSERTGQTTVALRLPPCPPN